MLVFLQFAVILDFMLMAPLGAVIMPALGISPKEFALVASIPIVTQRDSFNAISASIQQLSGGIASVIAGHIVTQATDRKLQHFEVAGYAVVATSLAAVVLLWKLQRHAESLNLTASVN